MGPGGGRSRMSEDRAVSHRLVEAFAAVRRFLHDLYATLSPSRASALSVVIGSLVLFQEQAQDLLRGVADHLPHRSANVWQLLLAVFVWGHTNWYFARVML